MLHINFYFFIIENPIIIYIIITNYRITSNIKVNNLNLILNCIICKKIIETELSGYSEGHNAEPITSGRCCAVCDDIYVIPARIEQIRMAKIGYSVSFEKIP